MSIKILRPSLDDLNETTVLRGIVDRESLYELRSDFYQREKLPASSRRDIVEALETGTQLPDIELGMRGETWSMEDDQSVALLDPVFIIDGRQRVETLKDFIQCWPECRAHLGAIIHFKTTADWERSRFHTLNTSRVKVSPNVLLRNIKDDVPAIATLYGLARTQMDFPLHNRVGWRQNMARDELISALTYIRTTLRLHSHLTAARYVSGVDAIKGTSVRVIERIGMPMLRENATVFWNFVDKTWGVRELKQRGSVPYLHSAFLQVLVDLISDHVDFWQQPREMKLVIPDNLRRKMTKFPIYDPEVMRLTGAGGKAQEALYFIMMTHLNSGKRTKRLVPRNARAHISSLDGTEVEEEEDELETPAA